jgi:hypothetical protein
MIACRAPLVALVCLIWCGAAVFAADEGATNRMKEWTFTSTKSYADPFNEVQLDMLVTAPDGSQSRVPAFWGGNQTWRVRYSSPQPGTHRWKLECSDKANPDLHGVGGTLELKPYTGENPLYRHGFVRVAPDKRHFEYTDGTPFFWLGDTWWMGLCHRMKWPDDVKKLATDRKEKGFNVIQIVAGLYPDMHPFDPRGANEAGFPWEKDYARIRPEYFDAADQRLQYLADEGFTPCIVGAWGYFMPWMGVDRVKQHWRYLIARYGAMPVVWCAAGEANLPWYLAKGFPYDDRKQVTDWTEVMRYIRATDPYHRPLTIHPTGIGRLSARHCTDDLALLDFDMLQTPHGERAAVAPTIATVRESYADHPIMPVIDGEASYERLMDTIKSEWTRQMFWICMTNGAAGHTYGANGIWQVNRRGQPHGPSPHHAPGSTGYGVIPWDEAMNLPGSTQVGLGKKLFEKYDWQKFHPHPEWAGYASDNASLKPAWGHWIWFDEGDPTTSAPVEKRFFRKTFELPDGAKPTAAMLNVAADDRFTAYLNGKRIGSRNGWESPEPLDVAAVLKAGTNILAIEAENLPAPVTANPAGLLCGLRIQIEGGKTIDIQSDASWRSTKSVNASSPDWITAARDDGWTPAKDLGPYGCKPWGKFHSTPSSGPFATGIPEKIRVIYVPDPRPIQVSHLEPSVQYRAQAFDPSNGKTTDLGPVTPNEQSQWTAKKPTDSNSADWVLILERK